MLDRIETKYLLSIPRYLELKNRISSLGESDKNSIDKNRYPVSTVYFDNSDLEFYNLNCNGDYHHKKVRCRWYSNTSHPKEGFLEYKFKAGAISRKIRRKLNLSDVSYLNFSRLAVSSQDIFFQKMSQSLSAISYIYYEREAYSIMLNEDLYRINFDTNIRFRNTHEMLWRSDLSSKIVMEIKRSTVESDDALIRLINCGDLNEVSFSKYTEAMHFLRGFQ